MDKLRELSSFLDKSRLRRIDVIGNPPPKKGRSEEFYEALLASSFETDREAAEHFFGKGVDETDRRYKELKERLYSKLLNTVFFVDETKLHFNKYQRAYYDLLRDTTAANILMNRSYYKNAVYLLEKSLKKAEQFEFFDIQCQILRFLKRYYGIINSNRKKFVAYDCRYKEVSKLLEIEHLAESYYALAITTYVEDRTDFEKHLELTTRYYSELSAYTEQYDILKLHVYTRIIELMIYTAHRDLEGTINSCDAAIQYLKNKPYANPNQINHFLKEKAVACLQLGRYEEGIEAVQETIQKSTQNNYWLGGINFLILLYFYTEQYEKVYENYEQVKKSKVLSSAPAELLETWIIIEAYLKFLIEAGILNKPKKRNLKVSKFLNEVPAFAKGKRSTNVPVLILQILFAILRKEHNKFIDRIAAVQRYNNRYLLKNNTFRSNCFIKMLVCVGEASFNRIATERRAAKFVKRLAEVPLAQVKQNYETEYIPYEKLWEIVLNLLDDSRYYR